MIRTAGICENGQPAESSGHAGSQDTPSGPPPAPSSTRMPAQPSARSKGKPRVLRDFVSILWLTAAIVAALNSSLMRWDWVLVHMVLLGALSHAVLVWSEYFTGKLTHRAPTDASNRAQDARVILLLVGGALVVWGFPTAHWALVVVGACLVATAVVWHAAHIATRFRGGAGGRFRVVARYYLAAACCLPLGATYGVLLAAEPGDTWRGRLMAAHIAINLFGWIGLTVVGTLLFLWPTVVRSRMAPGAERRTAHALWFLLVGVAAIATGATLGTHWLAFAGTLTYAAGIGVWAVTLGYPLRRKGMRDFAPASIFAGVCWAGIILVWLAVLMALGGWDTVSDHLYQIGFVALWGFALQLLFGALSYLMASAMGGAPSVRRAMDTIFNWGATFRIAVPNLALLAWLAPTPFPGWFAVLGIATLASFVPLMFIGAFAGVHAKRRLRATGSHAGTSTTNLTAAGTSTTGPRTNPTGPHTANPNATGSTGGVADGAPGTAPTPSHGIVKGEQ